LSEIHLEDAIKNCDDIIQGKKEKDIKVFKRSTNSWYKKQIRHVIFFMSWKGNVFVNQITTSNIISYKSHLLKTYATKTAKDYLLTLNEFFEYCKIKSYLTQASIRKHRKIVLS